jgi:sugar phosphate permease
MNPGTRTKDKRYELWRYRIFFITWISYFGFYLTRKSFSVAKIGMAQDPDILLTKIQMSEIEAAYLFAYAVGQFVWGMFGDRFGPRKILLTGLLCSVLVAVVMGLSSTVILFGVLFCIQGLCQSTGWAPLVKNMSYWFSQEERGTIMGWWATNYAIGGFVASPFAGLCADYFTNWRYGFFGPATVLFVIWALVLVLQKNKPQDVGLKPIEEYHNVRKAVLSDSDGVVEEGSWKATLVVIKTPMVLILGIFYFFLKPARYAILFWGPLYISEKLGTGMTKSAVVSVCFELGGPLGILAVGYISDKLFRSRRMPISIICLIALSALLFSFNYLAGYLNTLLIAGLLFAIGFLLFGPDSLLSGAAAVDFGTKTGASTASGFINGMGAIGAILGGALPGVIASRWGWEPLFYMLGITTLLSAIVLIPKWNALPKTADG